MVFVFVGFECFVGWRLSGRGGRVGVGCLVRVVRASDQRSGFDVHEPHVERGALQIGEFVGVIVADHRGVLSRGTEVLPDRQNSAARVAQIAEGRD